VKVWTKEKELAAAERSEYNAASPAERKGHKSIGIFIHARHPEVSTSSIKLRSRLYFANERADQLWLRIDEGMPLITAVRILCDSEATYLKNGKTGDIQDLVSANLARYDGSGTTRLSSSGKVYRASASKDRASRIASGDGEGSKRPKSTSPRMLKGAAREAIAAWISGRLPKDDDRVPGWVEECLREVEAVLDSFALRFKWPAPKKHKLYAACDLLNVPRPSRWGQPVDQQRARKHQRAALRTHHPDVVGHEGGVEAYQSINDAYQDIVAYNDSLSTEASLSPSPEENGNGEAHG
jgi:hypothetical protein